MERLVEQMKPRLAILDLDWVISNGMNHRTDRRCPALPLLRRWHEACPKTRFVILAAHPDAILIANTVELGIGGYLLKDNELILHLPNVARTICDGGCAFSQAVMGVKEALSAPPTAPRLTDRQIEILEAIVSHPNLTYLEQARRLEISKHTFDSHLRTIFQKLGVSSLTAAILTAVQLGMIPFRLLCSPADDG